jgi:hypothetical protein
MRTHVSRTQDRGQMDTRRTQLFLELDEEAEPITGRIGPVGGPHRGFTGYASLIAAIQSIRDGDESRPAWARRNGSESA